MRKNLAAILATVAITLACFMMACNPDNPMPVGNESQCGSSNFYYSYNGGNDTLGLPNAFTPDGDGLNDFYHPITNHASLHNFSLVIYKGSTVVFRMDSLSGYAPDGWDGRANHSGNVLPAGNFVARIKFTTDDGQQLNNCMTIHLLTRNTAQNCLNTNGISSSDLTFEDQFDPATGLIPYATGEEPFCP